MSFLDFRLDKDRKFILLSFACIDKKKSTRPQQLWGWAKQGLHKLFKAAELINKVRFFFFV